jgi:hypothetical protein
MFRKMKPETVKRKAAEFAAKRKVRHEEMVRRLRAKAEQEGGIWAEMLAEVA